MMDQFTLSADYAKRASSGGRRDKTNDADYRTVINIAGGGSW